MSFLLKNIYGSYLVKHVQNRWCELKLLLEGLESVVKIDCSKRLAFLLYDFKLISNQQQLISKTDTYVQSM